MHIVVGKDLFDSTADVKLVTAHSYLTKDNCLVMGSGALRDLAILEMDAPKVFGTMVNKVCGHLGLYGILVAEFSGKYYGLFQTKDYYRRAPRKEIISYSVKSAIEKDFFANKVVAMNFPGVGMSFSEVIKIVGKLPDNFYLYVR